MSDNVTAIGVAGSASWAVPALAGFVGATIAVLIREFIGWCRRPKLRIGFEAHGPEKSRVLDLPIPNSTGRAKFLRVTVRNLGRSPAGDSEGKMVIDRQRNTEAHIPVLHWARRNEAVYVTPERIYAPVHINRSDEEPLDLLRLSYEPGQPLDAQACIESVSAPPYEFERDTPYDLRVTVYARNAVSKPFGLKVKWNGTVEGFEEAFTEERT